MKNRLWLSYNRRMGFGVGFRSPFEGRTNPDDRKRADSAKTQGEQAQINQEAAMEHQQGRGSLGELISSGKSLGQAAGSGIGAVMGGISTVSHATQGALGLAAAYEDSGVHSGKDPTSG